MLEDSELDFPEESPPPEPKRAGNRGFLVAAGTLGAIMLLAMVGIAYYALVILPEQQAAEPPPLSAAELTGTAVALALQATNTPTNTSTNTNTPTVAPPTATRTSTSTLTPITPLFTSTFTEGPNGATQTVNALLTQAAVAQTQAAGTSAASATQGTPGTPTSTPSALPDSGFADNIGAPGLLAAAAGLLLIIFIARRLRANA
jgi:cytoskeletal protein RodZ